MRTFGGLVVGLLLSGCLDVTVPPRTSVGPGSLRATLLTALPNRPELAPAEGAKLTLVGTTLSATADAEGNVTLSGLTQRQGRVLVGLDVDDDGTDDRTRIITLEAVGAGLGKDVNLGTLVLGRNATVTGVVKRGDRRDLNSGHGGISVFLPQLPQFTSTGDDGTFVLPGVPEGSLVLNAFAPGYRPEVTPIEVPPGAELRMAPLVLQAAPGAAPVGSLRGRVEQLDGTPIPAVVVQVASGGMESRAETNAEGRFVFEVLPVGVYALGASKTGYTTLRVPTVLITAGATDLRVLVMTQGTSSVVSLDGGPLTPDAGSGGGAAGGSAGGMAGGSAGGMAGGTAGGMDGGAAGGMAGGAAGGTAGGTAGGMAGGSAGGTTMGPPPVANAGPDQLVPPGRPARLNGVSSQGDQPLSYRWTQVSGPTVVLSDNDTPAAEDPTFTAPGSGVVVEFTLVVTDRFGRVSTNLSSTRVAAGVRPVARFTPDGGVVIAAVPTLLQSVSNDDGGLPLLSHTWTLSPGAAATLSTDGGPSALLLPDALPFGSPDGLAEVTLSVTNSLGATSTPFTRLFFVRAVSPNNWTLDAGPQGAVINVVDGSTLVSLEGAFQTSLTAASPTFSWSCSPAQTLGGATSLNASFVAPIVSGPDVQMTCSVTGTAPTPYAPAALTANAYFRLRDGVAPRLIRGLEQPTRIGPFGFSLEFDEDITFMQQTFFCAGDALVPYSARQDGRIVSYRSNSGLLLEGSLCSVNATVNDRSAVPNATSFTRLNAQIQTVWHGPYVSSATFTDPRPVLVSLGAHPKAQQRRWNAPMPQAAPTQLLVSDGPSLLPLTFDPNATTPCGSPCALPVGSPISLGLPAGVPPSGQRTFWAGASMVLAVRPEVFVERNPGGTWSVAPPFPGALAQVGPDLVAVSVDGGALNRWTRAAPSSSFVFSETVATSVPPLAQIVGSRDRMVATTASSPSVMRTWDRVGPAWSERTLSTPPVDAGVLIYGDIGSTTPIHTVTFVSSSGRYGAYRTGDDGFLFSGTLFTSSVPTGSWHSAVSGGTLYVAAVEGGLLRLYQHPWGNIAARVTVPGPPRAGFSPAPEPLNLDLTCEAAAPSLTFVEDSLVITWQERCPPQTAWNVAVRVIR